MGQGFGGEDLFGGVDEREVEVERSAFREDLFLESVSLFGSASQEVSFVGPFVEFLGYGEEDFDTPFGIGFREPDVSEREDKPALTGLEESAHGTHRAKPFVAGKRMRGHDLDFWVFPDI